MLVFPLSVHFAFFKLFHFAIAYPKFRNQFWLKFIKWGKNISCKYTLTVFPSDSFIHHKMVCLFFLGQFQKFWINIDIIWHLPQSLHYLPCKLRWTNTSASTLEDYLVNTWFMSKKLQYPIEKYLFKANNKRFSLICW